MNNLTFQEQRKLGIGGSDIGAIMGKSKYRTAYQIWQDKLGKESSFEGNDATHWGKIHEPAILANYAGITGNGISTENLFIKSKKYPWLQGNIDAWVLDTPIILEAKTTRFYDEEWGENGSEKIPATYRLQCAHYCLIASEFVPMDGADIAVLGSTSDFRIYHYLRDKETEEKILEATHKFWHEHVLKGVPPEAQTIDDVNDKYPKEELGKAVCANTDIVFKVEQLERLRAQQAESKKDLKGLDERAELLEVAIKDFMGNAETLLHPFGHPVAFCKQKSRSSFSPLLLKAKYPEIHLEFTKTCTRRPLEICK